MPGSAKVYMAVIAHVATTVLAVAS